MDCKNLIVTSLIIFSVAAIFNAKQQDDHTSGAIKTTYGYLLVWNAPNNHYTLEIKGKNVRQTSTERVHFSVDGMFLQVLTAPIRDFIEDARGQKLDDTAILLAHRDWETKFMEGEYKEKLKVESSWQKLSNGKNALAWEIHVPESARSNVKKQIFLTLVKGDFVLMLGGVVTDTTEEQVSRQLLLNTIETLKVSDKPIDLRKLQESIRKDASTPISGDARNDAKDKTATLKGRVYRKDKDHPVADAVIVLLDDKKSDKQDNSVEARTDVQGNFVFEKVAEGKYTVSIRTWHNVQEDVPCRLLMAKTNDKDSSVVVLKDKDKFVEQVFIKGFSVKAGKENVKDFDIACKGLFGG